MLIFATLLLLFAGVPSISQAKPLTLQEVTEGVCRVGCVGVTSKVYGSGVVVKKTDTVYRILTNGHVANGFTNCTVEFFRGGKVSKKIPAKIVFVKYVTGTSMDIAVIEVNIADMLGIQPRVIPVAPSGFKYEKAQYIKGAGCPAARWCQAWEARIFNSAPNTISFNMPPEGGQSGSGVLVDVPVGDELVTCVAGVVTWRIGAVASQFGAGLSLDRIHNILGNSAKSDRIESHWIEVGDSKTLQVETPQPTCKKCGAPKALHVPQKYQGKDILVCPKCPHHGLFWNQHENPSAEEQQFCGPNGCFPYRWGGRPQQPQQPPQQPDGDIPNGDGQVPDINGPWVGPGEEEDPKPDDSLQKRIMELENEKSVLNSENAKLAKENKELDEANTNLNNELDVVSNEKVAIQETAQKLEKEKEAVVGENAGLKEKVTDLSAKLDKLNNVAKEAQTKIDGLVKLKDDFVEKHKLLEGENGGLKQKIAEHLGVIDQLKKHVDGAASKIDELSQKRDELITKIQEDKGPLGQYFRDKNIETVSVFGIGSLIGVWIWTYALQPFLIKRTGKIPARIIGAIGYRVLKKKVQSHLEDDDIAPPDILAEDLDSSVKKK